MNRFFTSLAALAIAAPLFALDSGTIGEYSISPQPGDIPELSTVTLDFTGTGFMGIDFPVTEKINAITLSAQSGDAYYAVSCDYKGSSDVTLHFAPVGSESEVTAFPAGTYTLNIPEKTFFEFYSTTKYNDLITAVYVVSEGSVVPPVAVGFDNPVVSPSPENPCGKLQTVSISFPELSGGLDWPINNLADITLQRQGDDTVYIANSPTLGGDNYRTISFGFNKPDVSLSETLTFSQAGTYTLSIAEGAFVEYGNPDAKSPALSFDFIVDPSLNFSCNILPDPQMCYAGLSSFTIEPGSTVSDLSVADDSLSPTLSLGATSIALRHSVDGKNIILEISDVSQLAQGDWTLSIPAGFLSGTSISSGLPMVNHEPVTAVYKVREPMTFDYSVEPLPDAVVESLAKVTIGFTDDGLKFVSVNPEAGTPVVSGASLPTPLPLQYSVSGKSVEFSCSSALDDGSYKISIPTGYIVTTDVNGLQSPIRDIDIFYTVQAPVAPDFNEGIIVINEGWFGHDNGSINFFPSEGPVYYNAFTLQNPDKQLGATSQSGQIFGNHLFVVSKMSPFLTAIDSDSFKFINQLDNISDDGINPQANAFCAVSSTKGYLSTSNGLYVVDLSDFSIKKRLTADWLASSKFGQLVRYGNNVLCVSQLDGIVAIDVVSDDISCIDIPTAAAITVAADGDIYVATLNEDNEIVKINPLTFDTTNIDIKADKAKIQNPWSTWREASFAADRDRQALYFATASWAPRSIAKYDLATGEFIPEFITLPGTADGLDANQILYGQGLAIDPATGYIVVNATEDGYGTHYEHNWLYFFDPASGKLIDDMTVVLRDYYWFPSMTLFPTFSAPELSLQPLKLSTDDGPVVINLNEATALKTGNKHLVCFSASSSDAQVFTTTLENDGNLTITPRGTGEATLSVSAEYQGRATRVQTSVTVNNAAMQSLDADNSSFDIFSITGFVIKLDASMSDVENLPAGLYIINGKKIRISK